MLFINACLFHQQMCLHRHEELQLDQSVHVLALSVSYQDLFHRSTTTTSLCVIRPAGQFEGNKHIHWSVGQITGW